MRLGHVARCVLILKKWYEGGSYCVKMDGRLSASYSVERGAKQGLVLSLALLLVMDPLLRQLQATGLLLSINYFYVRDFVHADDIITLATIVVSLEAQMAAVNRFSERNFCHNVAL